MCLGSGHVIKAEWKGFPGGLGGEGSGLSAHSEPEHLGHADLATRV